MKGEGRSEGRRREEKRGKEEKGFGAGGGKRVKCCPLGPAGRRRTYTQTHTHTEQQQSSYWGRQTHAAPLFVFGFF